MSHGLRQDRLREQRNVFLLFLGAVFISLMTALPIVTASIPTSRVVVPAQFRYATFEDLDRNHDGFVDGAEAAALPGLAGVLERADRNGDGRLDKVEFAKALAMMEGGTRL